MDDEGGMGMVVRVVYLELVLNVVEVVQQVDDAWGWRVVVLAVDDEEAISSLQRLGPSSQLRWRLCRDVLTIVMVGRAQYWQVDLECIEQLHVMAAGLQLVDGVLGHFDALAAAAGGAQQDNVAEGS